MVGESWQVDLELEGSLDEQGMVLDFGDIKKQVKNLIDDTFDHKLLVPADYQGLQVDKHDESTEIKFSLSDGGSIEHRSPNDAIRFIDSQAVTIESLTPEIIAALEPHLPDNVNSVQLRLWPEHCEDAYYHYSHGLKHHEGNCQRIAHGHRSRIVIYRNGSRDPALERSWAEQWKDIYIGTKEDVVDQSNDYLTFSYTSIQGEFLLKMPAKRCYLVDTDSTVENLAAHIAEVLKQLHPGEDIKIYAYEGVDKGAIG